MHSSNLPLYQSYKSYVYYLTFANNNNNCSINILKYLQMMIKYQMVKLCCVNYNEEFSKNKYFMMAKDLRLYCSKNKIKTNDKKMFLAIHFPYAFYLLFKIKRNYR